MIQALELHGCMFPGFLLPHPEMTNGNFHIAAHHFDKILQHIDIYMMKKNNDMNYYSAVYKKLYK